MNDMVISIKNVTKLYRLYNKPSDRIVEALNPFGKKMHKEHYAISDISFNVHRGETLGVIGANGAGKSTLLKIITGVLNPTEGEVEIKGIVSALLELGAGFNPEYTGVENIYLNGLMLGYTKEQIDEKMEEIIEFADIGDFLNYSVKTYSSGMYVRLAFAIAIMIKPDILIVDEALSVGDVRFQQKCYRKIEELKKTSTVLLVTHDMGAIIKFCDRVVWLDQGKVMDIGNPIDISKKYQAYLAESKISKFKALNYIGEEDNVDLDLLDITTNVESFGDKEAEILAIGLFEVGATNKIEFIEQKKEVEIVMKVKFNNLNIEQLIVGFTITDRLGNIIFQTNSHVLDCDIKINKEIEYFTFQYTMPPLNEGTYLISPAVASGVQENHIQHNWVHDAYVFNIINRTKSNLQGILSIPEVVFNQKYSD